MMDGIYKSPTFALDLGDDDAARLVDVLARRAAKTQNLYERGLCAEVARQIEAALAEDADGETRESATPWLDAPDGPGFWWMLVDGAAPEAVRVEVFDTNIGPYAQVTTTRHTFGPPDVLAPTAKWLRITPPTEPTR